MQEKTTKRIKIAGTIILIGVILFVIFYQMNYSKKLLETERETLQQEILNLKNEIKTIQQVSYKTKTTRDSLFFAIRPYMPYESMVKSTAQRDSIARLLPLKYGDAVYVLPDSLKGMIEGIVYGGNQFESYVKYKVLLKNNKYQEVNPTQLIPVSN